MEKDSCENFISLEIPPELQHFAFVITESIAEKYARNEAYILVSILYDGSVKILESAEEEIDQKIRNETQSHQFFERKPLETLKLEILQWIFLKSPLRCVT